MASFHLLACCIWVWVSWNLFRTWNAEGDVKSFREKSWRKSELSLLIWPLTSKIELAAWPFLEQELLTRVTCDMSFEAIVTWDMIIS